MISLIRKNNMDETTKCAVCGNETCTCPVTEVAPEVMADEVAEVAEIEAPAEETVA